MRCEEVLAQLEDYSYGELGDRVSLRLATHLRDCQTCRRAYEEILKENELYTSYTRDIEVTPAMWEAVRARTVLADGRQLRLSLITRLSNWLRAKFALPAARLATARQLAFALALVAATITTTLIVKNYLDGRGQENPVARQKEVSGHVEQPAKDQQGPAKSQQESSTRGEDRGAIKGKEQLGPSMAISPSKKPGPNRLIKRKQPESNPSLDSALNIAQQKIQRAEREYLSAINILTQVVNRRKASMDPALLAEYKKNLDIIDRSIEACRIARAKHPNDPVVAEFLLAAYAKKVSLLQEMAQ